MFLRENQFLNLIRIISIVKIFSFILAITISSNAMSASWANIFEAAMHGDGKDIEVYLEKGVSIELRDEDGFTPLLSAAMANNIDVVKYLIQRGANVDAQDSDKASALMGACISGQEELARILIDNGASSSLENIDGASSKDLCKALSPKIFDLL